MPNVSHNNPLCLKHPFPYELWVILSQLLTTNHENRYGVVHIANLFKISESWAVFSFYLSLIQTLGIQPVLTFCLWDRTLVCSQGYPYTQDLLASAT